MAVAAGSCRKDAAIQKIRQDLTLAQYALLLQAASLGPSSAALRDHYGTNGSYEGLAKAISFTCETHRVPAVDSILVPPFLIPARCGLYA